jgi:hypothetical protein
VPLDAVSQSNALDLHSLAIDLQSRKHKWVSELSSQALPWETHPQGAHHPPSPGLPSIYRGRKKTSRYNLFPSSNSSHGWSVIHSWTVRHSKNWPLARHGRSMRPGRTVRGQGQTVRDPQTDHPTPGRSKRRLSLKPRVYTDCPSPLSQHTRPLGKTTVTFSSDVRIRWSWTLWKAHLEDYPSQLNAWPKTLWIKAKL